MYQVSVLIWNTYLPFTMKVQNFTRGNKTRGERKATAEIHDRSEGEGDISQVTYLSLQDDTEGVANILKSRNTYGRALSQNTVLLFYYLRYAGTLRSIRGRFGYC
jgi:hypothetical protein